MLYQKLTQRPFKSLTNIFVKVNQGEKVLFKTFFGTIRSYAKNFLYEVRKISRKETF